MKHSLYLVLLALLCSLSPARAAWQRMPSASMDYWIYTPAQPGPRGLMLNLHGCTQSAQDFKDRGNWEASAEKYNLSVVIPDVPNGGVVLGCWDYYGADHTTENRHNGPLLRLVESLLADKEKALDPERVFVTGLSSGAGEALVLGCLRPDLFKGVGLVGAPALGTGQNDIAWPTIGAEAMGALCRRLAQGKSFANQRLSIVHGDQDFVVNPRHSDIIAEALAGIYEVGVAESFDVQSLEGMGNPGAGSLFRDARGVARLSLISAQGLGHAWPAGTGRGFAMKYINPNSLSYPAYVGAFFATSPQRERAR